jgi:superfamily II DNA or RNA helicase
VVQLRDYQIESVNGVRNSYAKGKKAPLLVMPTGAGKTVVFAHIAFSSAQRGRKVLILVHRVELLRQTQLKLTEFGIRTGLISPLYTPDYGAPIQVAMVQTLVKRLDKYHKFDLVVIDEAHHVAASTYLQIIDYYNCFQLGVTATPIRADGKGLGAHAGGIFDDMVLGPSTRELMDMGFLVEPEIYIPPGEFIRKGMRRQMGDFSKKELAERTDRRSITGNALDYYRNLAWKQPGVFFCVNVQHAKNVAQEARDMGLQAYSVDGSMDDTARRRILAGLGDGTVHVVTSCDVISEGTDIPAIVYGGSLRATESVGLHLQQIGRCLRPAPNKPKAIWVDHVGNCAQIVDSQYVITHGFPDDERNWTLDGEVKAKREVEKTDAVTLCQSCYLAFKPAPVCPHCGAERQVKPRKEKEVKDGELIKVDKNLKLLAAAAKKTEVRQARSLAELEAIAAARGYKKSWAKHIFNSREMKATG